MEGRISSKGLNLISAVHKEGRNITGLALEVFGKIIEERLRKQMELILIDTLRLF